MTPPAAAAAPRTRTRRATPPPRRVSGPARGKARTTGATVAAPPALALRIGGAVHGLAEHHFLDRLIRGRAWIGILAVGLMGIVFMQVSMLRLNAGIGTAVEKSATLERQNSAMRAEISELSSGERIAAEALQLGLFLPQGTPRYLHAGSMDARRAAASISAPGENVIPSATTTVTAPVDPTVSTTPVLGATGITPTPGGQPTATPEAAATPAAADPAATTTPATTATQTTPVAQEQAAAPPPASDTSDTGGVDASGQVG
jgi:cell division protein FtsL